MVYMSKRLLVLLTPTFLLLGACSTSLEMPEEASLKDAQPLILEVGDEELGTQQRVSIHTGCYVQAMDPHESHHVPGTVNVEGRTFCTGGKRVPYMKAGTALYKRNRFSVSFIDDGEAERNNAKKVSAFANGPCDDSDYSSYMEGFVEDNGKKYSGTDFSEASVTCD